MSKPKTEQDSKMSNFDRWVDRAKKLADTIVAMSKAWKILIGVASTLTFIICLLLSAANTTPPILDKNKGTIDFHLSIENNKEPQVISIIVGSQETPPY